MTELVDTHCHLNHDAYDADWADVRARAEAAGVTRLLCIGWDLASSRRAVELAGSDSGLYAAIGIHPESAGEWGEDCRNALAALYTQNAGRVTAYGEIGLDYHWESVPRERQQEVFAAQIAFAGSLSPTLPLIIHTRDALADTLAVLHDAHAPNPVVMHCFTGDTDTARQCLEAGYYLGIGGVATFKKSDDVRAAVAFAPLERLLLETDCPYLAPQFKRGKRNEPSYLPAVAETVASAKGLTVEEVARATTATARALFRLV